MNGIKHMGTVSYSAATTKKHAIWIVILNLILGPRMMSVSEPVLILDQIGAILSLMTLAQIFQIFFKKKRQIKKHDSPILSLFYSCKCTLVDICFTIASPVH